MGVSTHVYVQGCDAWDPTACIDKGDEKHGKQSIFNGV